MRQWKRARPALDLLASAIQVSRFRSLSLVETRPLHNLDMDEMSYSLVNLLMESMQLCRKAHCTIYTHTS